MYVTVRLDSILRGLALSAAEINRLGFHRLTAAPTICLEFTLKIATPEKLQQYPSVTGGAAIVMV